MKYVRHLKPISLEQAGGEAGILLFFENIYTFPFHVGPTSYLGLCSSGRKGVSGGNAGGGEVQIWVRPKRSRRAGWLFGARFSFWKIQASTLGARWGWMFWDLVHFGGACPTWSCSVEAPEIPK